MLQTSNVNRYNTVLIGLITGSAVWLGAFEDSTIVPFIPFEGEEWYNPYFQGFVVFFTYIILFQVSIVTHTNIFHALLISKFHTVAPVPKSYEKNRNRQNLYP